MKLGIHLIKANHGIIEGREPLTKLPQFLPIGLTEAFIQPLDRKTKIKGKLSAMIHDIYKLTRWINTWINPKKSFSQLARLASFMRPSLGIDSSLITLTACFLLH